MRSLRNIIAVAALLSSKSQVFAKTEPSMLESFKEMIVGRDMKSGIIELDVDLR